MATQSTPSLPRVENISCILPESGQLGALLLGNTFGAQDTRILAQYGIGAVLTLSQETTLNYSPEDIPFHLRINARDKADYNITDHYEQCFAFISQCRKCTNVFVHCHAGVSRSVAIVCIYLMGHYYWPLKQTLTFIMNKRIVAQPNEGFMAQLRLFQERFMLGKPLQFKQKSVKQFVPNLTRAVSRPSERQVSFSEQAKTLYRIPNNVGKAQKSINEHSALLSDKQPRKIYFDSQNDPYGIHHSMSSFEKDRQRYTHQFQNGNSSQRVKSKLQTSHKSNEQLLKHDSTPIPKVLTLRTISEYPSTHSQAKNKLTNSHTKVLSSAELPTSSRYGHPETGRSEPRKKLLSIHPTNIESGKNNYTRSNHENETVSNRNTPNNKSSAIYGLVNASSNAVKHEGGQLKERASTSRSIRPKDLPGYGKY